MASVGVGWMSNCSFVDTLAPQQQTGALSVFGQIVRPRGGASRTSCGRRVRPLPRRAPKSAAPMRCAPSLLRAQPARVPRHCPPRPRPRCRCCYVVVAPAEKLFAVTEQLRLDRLKPGQGDCDRHRGGEHVTVPITSADDGLKWRFRALYPEGAASRGACVSYMGTNHTS
jgi:hypothetical protein